MKKKKEEIIDELKTEDEVLEEAVQEETEEGPEQETEPEQAEDSDDSKSAKEWVSYERDDVERIVLKLSQEGKTTSQIGLILRDQYGIPEIKKFGFTVNDILTKNEKAAEIPEDLYNMLKKAVVMHGHLASNKKDKKNLHTLQLIESRVRKLGRYYSKVGKLPKDWKYDLNKARLLVKHLK